MLNTVEVVYEDKKNLTGGIKLNGSYMGVGCNWVPSSKNPFDNCLRWSVRLANIHNQSNPITFQAATMKTLVKKIEKHEYQLVKF